MHENSNLMPVGMRKDQNTCVSHKMLQNGGPCFFY